jgi:nucleoside-diphosphate-sugar epimerase
MRYLVTGAQGFLGVQVVNKLRATGAVVIATGRRPLKDVVYCDLSVAPDVACMVEQIVPDRIVHCAAHVPKTLEEYQDGSSAQASLHMLDTLLSASACPVVFISSMTVYGTKYDRPVAEQDAGDPTSAYGNGKWQGEQHLMAASRPALAVRIPGLFGPSRRDGLVYNVMHAAKYGRAQQLPDTSILWAAMHVDDAATSIVKLATSPINGFEAINIGYRGVYSIKTLISVACDIYCRHVDYTVKQPRFEFNLARAESRGAVPDCIFRDVLVKYGNHI